LSLRIVRDNNNNSGPLSDRVSGSNKYDENNNNIDSSDLNKPLTSEESNRYNNNSPVLSISNLNLNDRLKTTITVIVIVVIISESLFSSKRIISDSKKKKGFGGNTKSMVVVVFIIYRCCFQR
jgi:hypothetical protein